MINAEVSCLYSENLGSTHARRNANEVLRIPSRTFNVILTLKEGLPHIWNLLHIRAGRTHAAKLTHKRDEFCEKKRTTYLYQERASILLNFMPSVSNLDLLMPTR